MTLIVARRQLIENIPDKRHSVSLPRTKAEKNRETREGIALASIALDIRYGSPS